MIPSSAARLPADAARADSAVPRLVLMRHGETAMNRDGRFRGRADPPLTVEGERQARMALPGILDLKPLALFTSPRLRARQTVDGAQTALGLQAQVEATLDDFDYGEWTGKTGDEAAAARPTLFATWLRDPGRVQFPGGESVGAAVGRIRAFVQRIAQTHPGATVVAVTHDAIIRCAVCSVLDAPLAAFHRIAVDLASTTGLLVDPPRLLWINVR